MDFSDLRPSSPSLIALVVSFLSPALLEEGRAQPRLQAFSEHA